MAFVLTWCLCRPSFASDSPNATDCDGHGTHIGSTAVGRTVGVAKEASMVAVRVLDCTGAGQVAIHHSLSMSQLASYSIPSCSSSVYPSTVATDKGCQVVWHKTWWMHAVFTTVSGACVCVVARSIHNSIRACVRVAAHVAYAVSTIECSCACHP